jgi:hypothetical protein
MAEDFVMSRVSKVSNPAIVKRLSYDARDISDPDVTDHRLYHEL